ncbi:AAA family ATPase [Acinetobacter baumannii]|nr:AAA family ATPase [Acinetobacter baumannii]
MKYLKHIKGAIPPSNLLNVDIAINKKNLIITGKNGSGKTSFLQHLHSNITKIFSNNQHRIFSLKTEMASLEGRLAQMKVQTEGYASMFSHFNFLKNELKYLECDLDLEINQDELTQLYDKYKEFKSTYKLFNASRTSTIAHVNSTTSILMEKSTARNNKNENLGSKLEQHLVNIRTHRAFAFEKDNKDQLSKLDSWLNKFNDNLKILFEDDSVELDFNDETLKYKIKQGEKIFDFQSLSSGYQAIFDIFADLIVRTEFYDISPEELEGIVLIDEIDAHLHISLQRKILPFFTSLFPEIQFIVSTHSPFVVTSSCTDTLIYDISTNELYEGDLSKYSFDSIISELFHSDGKSESLNKEISSIVDILENDSQNFIKLREVVKNLLNYESKLDTESRSIFFRAMNHLLDNEELGDLYV